MENPAITYPVKLVKYISLCGVASRRNSFDMIKEGKVSVNGNIIKEPSYMVNETDRVCVDEKKTVLESFVYIMLNKPKGYVCTSSDPHADKMAIDLIDCPKRIFNVGRLDKDSEGLIIFTNDGDYANKLTHPKNSILKSYEVSTYSELPQKTITEILKGITDDGETLKAVLIKKLSDKKYLFVLGEGKKREIRRMVSYAGTEVTRLVRLSIGKLKLDNLKEGEWKYMTKEEISKSLL